MVVSTLSVQICNLLVWKMWFQFAMWCIQHDLMQIKSISSKTTSHEQNLLSQTYKSLLQWRNSAKKHEIRKVMGTRARKDALEKSFKLLSLILWKPIYNMNLKLHLDIPNRFGKLKKNKKLQSLAVEQWKYIHMGLTFIPKGLGISHIGNQKWSGKAFWHIFWYLSMVVSKLT